MVVWKLASRVIWRLRASGAVTSDGNSSGGRWVEFLELHLFLIIFII